jgi:hypothetical protein
MRWLIPGLLGGVLLTGSCSASYAPERSQQLPGGSSPAAPAETVTKVARPWRAGMPEYGINVYWENSPKDHEEVVRNKAVRILDYIVGLNANSVAFSFPIYTTGITSTSLKAGAKTPNATQVGIAVEEAARRGLRTSVRPILNEAVLIGQDPNAWRGTIKPADRDTWFANYGKLLLPYAAASSAAGATTFVVGTELNSMEGDNRWSKLIRSVKQKFAGEIAYSANFDNFQKGDVEVPADAIGVDAYLKLGNLGDGTGADRIADGWSTWLKRHDSAGPPVLHEVGIAAQNGAFLRPGLWGDASRPLNLTVQKRWYEGVCQALHAGDAGGVYWWKIDFDVDPAIARKDAEDRMTFVGRPAAQAIKKCFAEPA